MVDSASAPRTRSSEPPASSGRFSFSYVKVFVVALTIALAWMSLLSRQPVQALVALVTLLNLISCREDGDALMFFPLLFLSERCLHNVMSLGHSPLLFYASCIISYLQSSPLSSSSVAVGAAGVVVFSALTQDLIMSAGIFGHIAAAVVASRLVEAVTNRREAILIGHLAGFFASDSLVNFNLESAEKLGSVTSFPHVGGRLALLSSMVIALGMRVATKALSRTEAAGTRSATAMARDRSIRSSYNGKISLFFFVWSIATISSAYVYATWLFGEDAFVWLWAYLHGSKLRLFSLALWFTGIPIAVLVVTIVGSSAKLVVRRKLFHFIAVAAFTYPLIRDPSFMAFSAMVATALGVIAEVGRLYRVSGFGPMERFLVSHVDERDSGAVRTHLYLLFGMIFPAIFRHRLDFVTSRVMPGVAELMLDVSPGLISLGILDAFAAIAGTSVVFVKYRSTLASIFANRYFPLTLNPSLKHKTTTGTVCGILAASVFWALLLIGVRAPIWLQPLPLTSFAMFLVAGVFEAVTVGVDNLEIPLIVTIAGNLLCAVLLRMN